MRMPSPLLVRTWFSSSAVHAACLSAALVNSLHGDPNRTSQIQLSVAQRAVCAVHMPCCVSFSTTELFFAHSCSDAQHWFCILTWQNTVTPGGGGEFCLVGWLLLLMFGEGGGAVELVWFVVGYVLCNQSIAVSLFATSRVKINTHEMRHHVESIHNHMYIHSNSNRLSVYILYCCKTGHNSLKLSYKKRSSWKNLKTFMQKNLFRLQMILWRLHLIAWQLQA